MTITNQIQKANTATSSSSSSSSSSTGVSSSVTATKDLFLRLLVAQVKNQNPLSPMDANSFVGELAQFTGLEETITMRTTLEEIRTLLQSQSSGGKLPDSSVDGARQN